MKITTEKLEKGLRTKNLHEKKLREWIGIQRVFNIMVDQSNANSIKVGGFSHLSLVKVGKFLRQILLGKTILHMYKWIMPGICEDVKVQNL